MKLSTSSLIVFTLFSLFISNAHANEDNAKRIQENVQAYVMQQLMPESLFGANEDVKVTVKNIDPRIPIPQCNEKYTFSAPNYDKRLSSVPIKVSCTTLNWFTYVHVNIMRHQRVVVATDILSPGAILSENNLSLADINKSRLRGSTYADYATLVGARLKRRVREGTIITSNMLCFICKGDRITIIARAGGLAIKTSAIALEDGTLGETIRVENTASERTISGRVVNSSQIEINI
ncbi:flagellar basal body P-ring formation chaperone FlgA [Agaribacter marinus]|nr:flagellar basal body P-ring formation chaperone FlgA [Agaribacter marinus]